MSAPPEQPGQAAGDELRHLAAPAWLREAAEPQRVGAALVRHVPEFASGALTLESCEVRGLRLRDDPVGWTGTYLFTVVGSRGGRPQVVRAQGRLIPPGLPAPERVEDPVAFGSQAWRGYLADLRLELQTEPPETKLAALPQLTDREAARELLERSIRACAPGYHDLRIEACTPEVVRYKPGNRCTVLYRLEYAPGSPASGRWPEIVVAKTYGGDGGGHVYRAMRALWDSSLARSGAVAIAEPLAFLTELKVLVQGPVREEQNLKELLRSALQALTPAARQELHGYVRSTALGLAELHRCGVAYGDTVRWEDEVAEIRQQNARFAGHLPRQAAATTAMLARLERLAARFPADAAVPTHRSFRPAQVLLHKGEIGFVDFDGFCQAEPALDLALFMTEIRHLGLGREPPDPEARLARPAQMEEICDVFLDAYTSVLPVSRHRIALWEALDLITLLQGTWTKIKRARLNEAVFLLERHPITRDDQYR